MELTVTPTPLDGVVLIQPRVFPDARGFFLETWSARDFAAAGIDAVFVQDSHSRSTLGVLRGLHYQDMRAPQAKLVRCTIGSIFDVAVDIRHGSPTFGQWTSVELTAENKLQLFIPPGFAHGFQATSDVVEVQYKQTAYYTPAVEGTVAWNDPDVGVAWPLPDPILSDRDRAARSLEEYARQPAFQFGGRGGAPP
jgi:dTDP-4-dehydrorhamnose 3,5-epimerase